MRGSVPGGRTEVPQHGLTLQAPCPCQPQMTELEKLSHFSTRKESNQSLRFLFQLFPRCPSSRGTPRRCGSLPAYTPPPRFEYRLCPCPQLAHLEDRARCTLQQTDARRERYRAAAAAPAASSGLSRAEACIHLLSQSPTHLSFATAQQHSFHLAKLCLQPSPLIRLSTSSSGAARSTRWSGRSTRSTTSSHDTAHPRAPIRNTAQISGLEWARREGTGWWWHLRSSARAQPPTASARAPGSLQATHPHSPRASRPPLLGWAGCGSSRDGNHLSMASRI